MQQLFTIKIWEIIFSYSKFNINNLLINKYIYINLVHPISIYYRSKINNLISNQHSYTADCKCEDGWDYEEILEYIKDGNEETYKCSLNLKNDSVSSFYVSSRELAEFISDIDSNLYEHEQYHGGLPCPECFIKIKKCHACKIYKNFKNIHWIQNGYYCIKCDDHLFI